MASNDNSTANNNFGSNYNQNYNSLCNSNSNIAQGPASSASGSSENRAPTGITQSYQSSSPINVMGPTGMCMNPNLNHQIVGNQQQQLQPSGSVPMSQGNGMYYGQANNQGNSSMYRGQLGGGGLSNDNLHASANSQYCPNFNIQQLYGLPGAAPSFPGSSTGMNFAVTGPSSSVPLSTAVPSQGPGQGQGPSPMRSQGYNQGQVMYQPQQLLHPQYSQYPPHYMYQQLPQQKPRMLQDPQLSSSQYQLYPQYISQHQGMPQYMYQQALQHQQALQYQYLSQQPYLPLSHQPQQLQLRQQALVMQQSRGLMHPASSNMYGSGFATGAVGLDKYGQSMPSYDQQNAHGGPAGGPEVKKNGRGLGKKFLQPQEMSSSVPQQSQSQPQPQSESQSGHHQSQSFQHLPPQYQPQQQFQPQHLQLQEQVPSLQGTQLRQTLGMESGPGQMSPQVSGQILQDFSNMPVPEPEFGTSWGLDASRPGPASASSTVNIQNDGCVGSECQANLCHSDEQSTDAVVSPVATVASEKSSLPSPTSGARHVSIAEPINESLTMPSEPGLAISTTQLGKQSDPEKPFHREAVDTPAVDTPVSSVVLESESISSSSSSDAVSVHLDDKSYAAAMDDKAVVNKRERKEKKIFTPDLSAPQLGHLDQRAKIARAPPAPTVIETIVKKRGRRPGKKNIPVASNNVPTCPSKWTCFKSRFNRQMTNLRRSTYYQATHLHQLQLSQASAASTSDFSAAQHAQCEREIIFAKVSIRQIMQAVLAENSADIRYPELAQGDSCDVSNINCSRCHKDGCDGNDILFCDHLGCNRAYHQLCLEDPVPVILDSVGVEGSNIKGKGNYKSKEETKVKGKRGRKSKEEKRKDEAAAAAAAAAQSSSKPSLSNDPNESWFCCQCLCIDQMYDAVGEFVDNLDLKELDLVFPEVSHLELQVTDRGDGSDRIVQVLVDRNTGKKYEGKLGTGSKQSYSEKGHLNTESDDDDYSLGGEDGLGAEDSASDSDDSIGHNKGSEGRSESPDFWDVSHKPSVVVNVKHHGKRARDVDVDAGNIVDGKRKTGTNVDYAELNRVMFGGGSGGASSNASVPNNHIDL